MATPWSPQDRERIDGAPYHHHAADELPRRRVPIWVISVGGQAYVRTWYRRDKGWFAHALASRRVQIRLPGLEVDVAVDDIGGDRADLRAGIDAAYAPNTDALAGRPSTAWSRTTPQPRPFGSSKK